MQAEPTLAEQMRTAILASGKTHYSLAAESGVPRQRIDAFAAGGDMRLAHAGRLMWVLGLAVVRRKPPKIPSKVSARVG